MAISYGAIGPLEHKPAAPHFEWTRLPVSYKSMSRQTTDCIWLQGVEGDVTRRPTIYEVIPTDYGFVAGSGREREDDLTFLPANVMIMPFQKSIASVLVGVHL